ncbi:uncharacterized protein [Rutidosis leptorrhynchoides]|uniref:uncharacterized protein n=1 Tax=Rutidosis leptorrhynchoides TaxID=125765 RepID=UPI003A990AD4
MIKRRFYKVEHGDKDDAPSDSSSSSSDSELDAQESSDEEAEDDVNNVAAESSKQDRRCSSSSSGYESEDSSANEVNLDSPGSPINDDVSDGEIYKQDVHVPVVEKHADMVKKEKNYAMKSDVLDCVLKSKSVFKCKLCPRIVCLSEETLTVHLKSKRHARSEKLFKEGRLKMMLNSDGEIEDAGDGETHQERYASTLALVESNKNAAKVTKKNRGRQRQRKRLKEKTSVVSKPKNTKKSAKKSRKSDI